MVLVFECVDFLLSKKADLNIRSVFEATPLWWTIKKLNLPLFRTLVDADYVEQDILDWQGILVFRIFYWGHSWLHTAAGMQPIEKARATPEEMVEFILGLDLKIREWRHEETHARYLCSGHSWFPIIFQNNWNFEIPSLRSAGFTRSWHFRILWWQVHENHQA